MAHGTSRSGDTERFNQGTHPDTVLYEQRLKPRVLSLQSNDTVEHSSERVRAEPFASRLLHQPLHVAILTCSRIGSMLPGDEFETCLTRSLDSDLISEWLSRIKWSHGDLILKAYWCLSYSSTVES